MKRKRSYGGRSRRRGKRARRSFMRRRRVPRSIAARTIKVYRKFWSQNWVPATTNTIDFYRYYTFTVTQIPNWTEYQALFDEYKVNWFKYTFRPRYDSFAGNDTTDTTLPGVTNQSTTYLHTLVDPKTYITPSGTYTTSNLNTFLEQGKSKTYQGTKPVSVLIKYPCVAEDTNATADAKYVKAGWNSTNNPGVRAHRGFFIFAQDQNMTGVFGQTWDIFVECSVSFRGQR